MLSLLISTSTVVAQTHVIVTLYVHYLCCYTCDDGQCPKFYPWLWLIVILVCLEVKAAYINNFLTEKDTGTPCKTPSWFLVSKLYTVTYVSLSTAVMAAVYLGKIYTKISSTQQLWQNNVHANCTCYCIKNSCLLKKMLIICCSGCDVLNILYPNMIICYF